MTVSASLSCSLLCGDPGGVVACDLELTNQGNETEVVGLQLSGPGRRWAIAPPNKLSVRPGESERARLAFAVPPGSDAGPGSIPFAVAVAGQELAGSITVAEVRSVRVRVSPLLSRTRSRRPVRHTATILNTGNTVAEGRLLVDGVSSTFRVAPGCSEAVDVDVAPRKVGSNRVPVVATVDGAGPVTAEALVIRDPALPRPARAGLVAVAAVVALATLLAVRPAARSSAARSAPAAPAVPLTTACPPPPGPADVPIAGFAYCPATVTVAAGTEVRWVNTDLSPHTVTAATGSAAAFDSTPLATGQTFALRFDVAGTYGYFCRFHPGMHATVVVT